MLIRTWPLALLLFASHAVAQAPAPHHAENQPPVDRPTRGNFVGEPGISPELMTEGFLTAHPDLRWRREGLHAYANKRYDEAMRYFLRASRHADKPAQAMIAEMHWKGIGVPQDRPLGYAWMDLAAERGNHRLLAQRERYWDAMSEVERAQALALGEQVYAEFGDAVAQRRLETVLRREKNRLAGSRTGYTGNTQIIAPIPGIGDAGGGDPSGAGTPTISVPASSFYDSAYWDPKQYYAWRERLWEREQRELQTGVVEVRGIEQVKTEAAEKARKGN